MNPIIEQTIYYFVVLVLSFFLIGILLKGFFWKFVRVRISFGRFILCKIRAVNRDYYSVGEIEENFLIFTSHKQSRRICVKDSSVFYKSVGITWVDIDDQKNSLVKPDFSTVDGFDAVKYNNLYKRTLYSPSIADNQEKIIIGGIILIIVLLGITAFFIYKQNYSIEFLTGEIGSLKASVGGIIKTNI